MYYHFLYCLLNIEERAGIILEEMDYPTIEPEWSSPSPQDSWPLRLWTWKKKRKEMLNFRYQKETGCAFELLVKAGKRNCDGWDSLKLFVYFLASFFNCLLIVLFPSIFLISFFISSQTPTPFGKSMRSRMRSEKSASRPFKALDYFSFALCVRRWIERKRPQNVQYNKAFEYCGHI